MHGWLLCAYVLAGWLIAVPYAALTDASRFGFWVVVFTGPMVLVVAISAWKERKKPMDIVLALELLLPFFSPVGCNLLGRFLLSRGYYTIGAELIEYRFVSPIFVFAFFGCVHVVYAWTKVIQRKISTKGTYSLKRHLRAALYVSHVKSFRNVRASWKHLRETLAQQDNDDVE